MLEINALTSYLCGILAVLVIIAYWFFRETFKYWEKRNVPFLVPTIPFGNVLKVLVRQWTLGEAFGESYLEFKRRGVKHGGIYIFSKPFYIPVDENIIKRIIISDADNFPNRGLYNDLLDEPLSSNLFSMEGNRWKDIRTKLPQAFTSAKMRKMFPMITNFAEELKNHLQVCQKSNPTGIDIKTELMKFTADVISTCGFGLESNSMKGLNKDLLKHGRSFFDYQFHVFKNAMVFVLPKNFLKKINFRIFKKETTAYVKNMFLQLKDSRKKENAQREDLANTILKLNENNSGDLRDYSGKHAMDALTEDELVAQMWAFFCASFETSSTTVTFALYELAQNPGYQNKLRQDINEVLARHGNQITYEAVTEMKYLECVVDETLRKYPVLPILPRKCKEDYQVPGTDLILEKDTFVVVANYGIQRDPEYYPDPLKFDPDRFTNENKGRRPFIANLPFGEGPRICIGKRFGLLQSKIALMTLIKNYNVTLSEKTTADFSFAAWELILRKTGDIWLHLERIE